MKVLILGSPRTGTTSVGQALSVLSYKVHKGIGECFQYPEYFDEFIAAMRAKCEGGNSKYTKTDFDRFIGNYDAAHGLGVVALADELLVAYPGTKVILTPRDAESWVQSWYGSVMYFHKRWHGWRHWIWICAGGRYRGFQQFREICISNWCYGDPFDEKKQWRFYEDYNEHIRQSVPKDRLLEFSPEQGWLPLCIFLQEPVPQNVPFPHATARVPLNKQLSNMWVQAQRRATIRISLFFAVFAIVSFQLVLRT